MCSARTKHFHLAEAHLRKELPTSSAPAAITASGTCDTVCARLHSSPQGHRPPRRPLLKLRPPRPAARRRQQRRAPPPVSGLRLSQTRRPGAALTCTALVAAAILLPMVRSLRGSSGPRPQPPTPAWAGPVSGRGLPGGRVLSVGGAAAEAWPAKPAALP